MEFTPLVLAENGEPVALTFRDLLAYHGHQAPGGVAHGAAMLHRALPLLSDRPPERREIAVVTPFRGPGLRDAVEMATRAVTGGRFTVDAALAATERGPVLQNYVFRVSYRDREVTLRLLDDGFVVEEYLVLSARTDRSEDDERRLRRLKLEMAARILARRPDEVYEPTPPPASGDQLYPTS